MEQFIQSHRLISWNAVEKLIGAPTGTIRIDGSRRIPEKYKQAIMDIIKEYGYKPDDTLEEPVNAGPSDMLDFYYKDGLFRYVATDKLNRTANLNGKHVLIEADQVRLDFKYLKPFE